MSEGKKLDAILRYVDSSNGASVSTSDISRQLGVEHGEAFALTNTLIVNGDVRDCTSKNNEGTLDVFGIRATKAAIHSNKYSMKEESEKTASSTQPPTVFLSYCWANSIEAETIYTDLTQVGIRVIKDTHELRYKDDIDLFMQSIRNADYALLLISDPYLKSSSCMSEIANLSKEQEFKSKVLPVILGGTKIFSPSDRIAYIKHWQNEGKKLKQDMKGLDPINAGEVYKDLKLVNDIAGSVDGFLRSLKSMMTKSFAELKSQNYKPVIEAIGFTDLTWATELLAIPRLKTIAERETALDEYSTKHPANTYYYAIKAQTCVKAKRYEQAKFNFLQSLKLNSENVEALNNLGQLYENHYKEYANARDCYTKVISIEGKLTIARLNLGLLLLNHFNDDKEAEIQYKAILDYDPNNPMGLNNLGNLYMRRNTEDSIRQAESCYKKAIEYHPTFADTYVNYGSLLIKNKRSVEGYAMYEQVKQYDLGGGYSKLVDGIADFNTRKKGGYGKE